MGDNIVNLDYPPGYFTPLRFVQDDQVYKGLMDLRYILYITTILKIL